ncbi:hypothetical protein LYNGBM3L_59930 [Moorena producens 3L]|uniref:Uncharacterized protein n=1 Tax=Moorena producens 3L TaxID=489825 RepID=F4Y073_9CYAN|nr:hypothetical protein LYNGBM3L_59930 [Moorena producens 3L]
MANHLKASEIDGGIGTGGEGDHLASSVVYWCDGRGPQLKGRC